jgi:hypothetical protein
LNAVKNKGENAMFYNKPEVVVLGPAVKGIQNADPKNEKQAQDGAVFNGYSTNAYQADE